MDHVGILVEIDAEYWIPGSSFDVDGWMLNARIHIAGIAAVVVALVVSNDAIVVLLNLDMVHHVES